MSRLEMKVVGSTRVANNLRKMAANSENTAPAVKGWAQMVRGKLKGKGYPSYLSHFKHKRTGALANKWAVEAAGKNSYSIVNRANRRGFPYPVVVVGNAKGQRKGRAKHPSFARWWIARDVIEENVPELRQTIADHVMDV